MDNALISKLFTLCLDMAKYLTLEDAGTTLLLSLIGRQVTRFKVNVTCTDFDWFILIRHFLNHISRCRDAIMRLSSDAMVVVSSATVAMFVFSVVCISVVYNTYNLAPTY
ncbi:PREDICTED: uncharacterized protein LOC108568111 [Nicrophorus vespilloides]|uniref:Uncharacterized protein LOC108568111 n=1 Tax=Nicrophorus vespilloides TaxID=110193 RepID=A0ABM1NCH4_NICVS|nr:PREDICTED: uncharacterized protein LOC108568111 [Nicrophorus vespilloides]